MSNYAEKKLQLEKEIYSTIEKLTDDFADKWGEISPHDAMEGDDIEALVNHFFLNLNIKVGVVE